jgi:hypothetical protein
VIYDLYTMYSVSMTNMPVSMVKIVGLVAVSSGGGGFMLQIGVY